MFNFTLKRILLIVLGLMFFASFVLNIWLSYQLAVAADTYKAQKINARVLDFTDMFIEKVLLASREVDFDTRLTLETAVRTLGDEQIFDQWQRFTKAQTRESASTEAKLLLDLLVKKIKANN